MVSDFILSLDSVQLAIVYADREGGFKFSVRSEIDAISAGVITKMALEGIGDGGGHAEMAGGMILPGSRSELGHNADAPIRERFLNAYKKILAGK
jgi:nanoRNase/pAp phosphatase (c-di-AMP/oligoRNAs hydrolase)